MKEMNYTDIYICPKCNERMELRGGPGIEEFYCSADRLTAEFIYNNRFLIMLHEGNYPFIEADTFEECCAIYKKSGFPKRGFS